MKKSLAVMLALIMVLCMIPTTAFAASMSWTWTVTIFGGNYYRSDGTETSTNRYTINQHLNNSVDHEIGYKFEWNASAGGSSYNGGWQLCLTVDGKIVERSTAYIYEKDMSNASGTWTAPASSHTGNSSHPFTLYLSDYPARFQNIKLTYDANGGTNAPASETKQVEKGKSATFTVSTQEPTRENYTFKGWSTEKNAATAEFIGGNSITTSQNTTLYAVWEEDNTPIEPPTPDKPNPPKPENTPEIPGLNDININAAVKVKCETVPASHEEKTFGFNWFSCQVGEVINDNNEYFCTITVLPGEYVTAYNVMHYPGHTLDPDGQKDTLTLKWNATDKQWENTDSAKLPITFTVKCDTVEPTKPDKPGEGVILDLINKINVQCIANTDPKHPEKGYDPIEGSYDVDEVSGDKEKGYTCEITVKPEKYVEKYNADVTGTNHTLAAGEGNKTVTLKYDSANDEWKVDIGMPVVFKVQCDNTQPPLDGNITIEVSKVWHDDSNTVPKQDKITVLLLADGKEVDRATIPDVNGAWSHSFGAKPANDNGKPINYTVKEENVPDWTPYYYTAGLWKGKLIFQIHNVPTKNTREIKVTKTVSGEGADKAKYFDFKVTLLEYHDNAEVTDQPGYYPLGGTYTFGGVTFTNGVATFKLKDGDSKEITGIPTHIYSNLPLQYKVEEIAPSGYTVKVNGSAGSSINGAFTDAKTVNITFENVKESGTNPTPTPTPGGGNGGGGHWHPTTPVPVIVIPPKTGDMTIWQSILHFLGIR